MQRSLQLGVVLLLAVVLNLPAQQAAFPQLTDEEQNLLELVNKYRGQKSLKSLSVNRRLCEACDVLLDAVCEAGVMSHHAGGKSPSERVTAAGYRWKYVAENIAYSIPHGAGENENYPARTLQQWMNSPPHNTNLLSRPSTECGVAIEVDENTGRKYATIVFARPR